MGKVKDLLERIGRYKYVITILLFLAIICVFDQNNLILRWQHHLQQASLEKEIEYYEGVRDSSIQGLNQLDKDIANMERIAREKYGMHLPDEDIFIIR